MTRVMTPAGEHVDARAAGPPVDADALAAIPTPSPGDAGDEPPAVPRARAWERSSTP
jgi:hypothetical protein